MDKFQTQILPGLVANMIAGKNPFKMPQQMRKAQAAPSSVFQQALAQRAMLGKNAPVAGGRGEEQRMMMNRVDQRMQQRELQEEDEDDDDLEDEDVPRRRSSDGEPQSEAEHQRRDLARRLKSSPRLKGLLQVN